MHYRFCLWIQPQFRETGIKWSHTAGIEDKQMETTTRKDWPSCLLMTILLIAGSMVYSNSVFANDAISDKRLSITTQNTKSRRDSGVAGVVTTDEYDALDSTAEPEKNLRSTTQSKTTSSTSSTPNTNFWFYAADVVLFNDHDGDGYYYGIDLLFDADTYFTAADVYAVIYLSLEGGSWNEYAATEDFTIFGTSSDDEYVVVTELLSGYPSGSYDILIELFDAHDDAFVASFGPDDTSELAFLPLEDADRDAPVEPEIIVIDNGGGGSLAWLSLLMLAMVAVASRRRYTLMRY